VHVDMAGVCGRRIKDRFTIATTPTANNIGAPSGRT
jgi:hypothetical protein